MDYAYRADAWQTLYTAVAGLLLSEIRPLYLVKLTHPQIGIEASSRRKKIIADILSAICPLFIFLYIALSKQTVQKK